MFTGFSFVFLVINSMQVIWTFLCLQVKVNLFYMTRGAVDVHDCISLSK